ncbi:venom acid phosphatase Acph-1-like isoform X2 [Homalodisca vitripennis]|nr:venom acid phosphatase Acph-1-like isoform X2 [Homalodisca vitripennis]
MNDREVWPHGAGQLTTRGRVRMYQLGEKLRSLYNRFLDDLYHPGDIVIYSTHFDRCFDSAQLILAGLYPPRDFQVWNRNIPWQPIRILYTDKDHVMIVFSMTPKWSNWCPKFRIEQEESLVRLQREIGSNLTRMLEYSLPYMSLDAGSHKLNTSIGSMWMDTYTLWESIVNPELEGLKIPSWVPEIYPQPIASLIVDTYKAGIAGSDTMIRLMSGQIFQEAVGFMKARLKNETSLARQLYLYTGHDFTIVGLQRILGLTDTCHWVVEPSSALILELHTDPATHGSYIKVLYIDGVSKDLEPVELAIPGCDFPCSIYQLMNMTEKYYNVTDWQKECES